MKHKNYFKNVLREIKGSFGRFMSIFSIVALGAGFLAGLFSASPDMRDAVDSYYDRTNFMDIRIASTLGLTDDDVTAIGKIDGVQEIMPSYSIDALIDSSETENIVTRLYSLPSKGQADINDLDIVEGRKPKKADECVAVKLIGTGYVPQVGDYLTVSNQNTDIDDKLSVERMKVVGVATSSYNFSVEKDSSTVGTGTVATILYLPQDAFKSEAYSSIFVRVKDAHLYNCFNDEYSDVVDKTVTKLKNIGDSRCEIRYNSVVDDANREIDKAKKKYNDSKSKAEKKLSDASKKLSYAQNEITANEIKIAKAQSEIAAGKKQLSSAKAKLSTAMKQKDNGYSQYYTGLKKYNDSKKTTYARFDQGRKQINDGLESINKSKSEIEAAIEQAGGNVMPEWETALQELNAKEAELNKSLLALNSEQKKAVEQFLQAKSTLDKSLEKLKAADKQIASGNVQIAASEKKLANAELQAQNGKTAIASAKIKLSEGKKEYQKNRAKADKEFAEAEKKIKDAEEKVKDIEKPDWYVLDRTANPSYVSFKENAKKVEAVSVVFPLFFFLVAALVALTTMTRMVDEQRMQIGTFKALGYSNRMIALKYVVYASIATVLGSAIGLVIGMKVLPSVIWQAYGIMYILPAFSAPIRVNYFIITSVVALVCIIAVTLLAVRKSLSESAASLMLPKAPKAGKRVFMERITFIWSRLKFTQKVTIRNILRYKKRFFMTVIGIVGCSALLLAGFGLRDSINSILSKQYGELSHYDITLQIKGESALENKELKKLLSGDKVSKTMPVHEEIGNIKIGSEDTDVNIYIPKSINEFSDFITLRSRKNHMPVKLANGGAVISEKTAETYGISVGDTVKFTAGDGKEVNVKIGGITENYVYAFLYMTPEYYQKLFGKLPEYNMILVNAPDMSEQEEERFSEEVLKIDDVSSLMRVKQTMNSFKNMLKSIDYIVLVLIICAGMLAFVVIYNLTNINITERQRELATIKVLGFYDGEVSAYVYRETAILTVIGTAIGLFVGIFLHRFIVKTAEVDMAMFGREISLLSFVFAAALTFFFSMLVNLVMHRKLKKIDMVESLKSGE